MSHVYCSECGFQNPEVANYCARCGSLLREEDSDETTQSYTPEEEADIEARRDIEGPALVIRSGGGRAGEHFALEQERTTIGRSPDCHIFLDDVTVSRRHAVALKQGDAFVIEDQGSLNGTFLNRRRIESAELSDDDELQIGKYRLVFFAR
ncbi:MAG: FHA domain-containing protein [Gaiellaceae bacterium]